MNPASRLPISELAQRCGEETDKFSRQLPNDPQFCFELMRRALVDQASDAFTHIYRIYERLALSWALHHSRFETTGENASYFVNAAFRAFYFALRGEQFERISSLPAALNYLKACVNTAIMLHVRSEERRGLLPLEYAAEVEEPTKVGERVEASEVWARIEELLPDAHDRLLARSAFVYGLKPREIAVQHPEYWADERTISVALYRIRRILRADPELAALFEHSRSRAAGTG